MGEFLFQVGKIRQSRNLRVDSLGREWIG